MPINRPSSNENSESINEIVTAVPKWIIRWGITLIFFIVMTIITVSNFISYPDIIKVDVKINSLNSPKPILAKRNGKLSRLLVLNGQNVKKNQPLGYLESTADPNDIIILNDFLGKIKASLGINEIKKTSISLPKNLNLGELQASYQNFCQKFLLYQATLANGYYTEKTAFVKNELIVINKLRDKLMEQRKNQALAYINLEEEYKAYLKLYNTKVISRNEFMQQENKFLSAKSPISEMDAILLNNSSNYQSKEKELFEIRHIIADEQAQFRQALNSCQTEINSWMLDYVLTSPINGRLSFSGIVQENQNFSANQEMFVINPGNTDFFGEVEIPQFDMGEIAIGQKAIIKLKSYPYEQYGFIRGDLSYVSDVALRDSIFIGKIDFKKLDKKSPQSLIRLKNGMTGQAEIITKESSLLARFYRNINKLIKQ